MLRDLPSVGKVTKIIVLEECVRRGNTGIHQVFIQGNMIDFSWNTSFQDGFNLRAEDQPLSIPVVIERFLPEAVAGSQQTLAVSVPDGEGKHAAQVPDT